jgi:dTDP-4-dehydrorhamnose 3,5-epimerase
MEFIPLSLPGLFLLKPKILGDIRGNFLKTYSHGMFRENNIDFTPREAFYSVSKAGVVRGMHFQAPPSEYGKLVHCLKGRIYDVSLDIRVNSPTYGQAWSGQLDDVKREAIYLPPGFAHGFYGLEADTVVSYLVSHVHDSICDKGIRWDSFGHPWPCRDPILSERDKAHPPFSEFVSPFVYP